VTFSLVSEEIIHMVGLGCIYLIQNGTLTVILVRLRIAKIALSFRQECVSQMFIVRVR
jgi:hypothetical protein